MAEILLYISYAGIFSVIGYYRARKVNRPAVFICYNLYYIRVGNLRSILEFCGERSHLNIGIINQKLGSLVDIFRVNLRLIGSAGWLLTAFLADYAILRRWPDVRDIPRLYWGMVGLIMGIWALMVVLYMRGASRLAAMGRDLRPPACRPSAFPRSNWLRDRSVWWTAAYVAGLFLLLRVLPR